MIQTKIRVKRYIGNGLSLLEYSFIGLLVCVVCMSSLYQIGGNVSSQFQGMLSQSESKPITKGSSASGIANAANIGSALRTVGSAGPNLFSGISPEAMENTILVSGANGAINTLSSTLADYIKNLQGNGQIDEAQANLLIKLANEGHGLGKAIKALEESVLSDQQTVTYEGVTYSVKDFSERFGFVRNQGPKSVENLSSSEPMAQTEPFISLYKEIERSGALKDPETQKIVETLAQQIALVSDLAKWNLDNQFLQSKDKSGYQQALAAALESSVDLSNIPDLSQTDGSTITHNKSGQICGTGRGQDSGASCAP